MLSLDVKKADEVLRGSLNEFKSVKKQLMKKINNVQKYSSIVNAVYVSKNGK